MLTKVKGVLLHHIKYGESSEIAYVYTNQYGRQSYLIRSIRGKRSKFSQNILQPLFLLEFEVYYKSSRELQTVKEIWNYIPFRSIPYDLHKGTQAMFLAEVLYKTLKEEVSNPQLFEFLENSIQLFDVFEEDYSNFHILFLIQLTRYLGFFPDRNYSKQRPYFDLRNGSFISTTTTGLDILGNKLSELFYNLIGTPFKELGNLKINHTQKVNLLDALLGYYQLHFHGFKKVKSLPVIKEVLKD